MKLVKILLAISLLTLAFGKVSAQVNVGTADHSVRATEPGEGPSGSEGF